jgi:hypothetical protein
MIYKGYLYVIISRQKEAIEALKFSLKELNNK